MTNIQEGKPQNYEELKKLAKNKNSWSDRLTAVEELGKWKCKETTDILRGRMVNDDVYKVQESAFRKLQAFGEKVKLPRKKKGNLISRINQTLAKIKHKLPDNHTYEEFKEAFRMEKIAIYDTYEGDKESRFDEWLENTWNSLPKKK